MRTTKDGFVTANDTELFGRVAERLNEILPSLNARVEHMGGGIFCISIEGPKPGQFMYWGVETGTWGADINEADGGFVDSIMTDVVATSPEVGAIATSILTAVNQMQSDNG